MKILEPAKEIEIINEVDVCVIGGSCTGVFAAIRAAQMGMKTAIVEKQNCFGGVATSGLVHIWHSLYDTEHKQQIIGGLTSEIIENLKKRSAVLVDESSYSSAYKMNTEELKIELDQLILEHSVTPYLHTSFSDAIVSDGKITSIIIENKDGRSAISAKFFIDATGDGDLCRRLGVPSYVSEGIQPPTMCAKILGADSPDVSRLIQEHYEEFNLQKDWGWRSVIPNSNEIKMHAETHVFNVNCAHANDLTYSEMEGRRQIRAYMDLWRKYMPSSDKLLLVSLPSYIGVRETYHIKSCHQITNDELLSGTHYTDAIGNGSYRVDTHHSEGSGITFKYLNGKKEVIPEAGKPAEWGRWRDETETNPTYYQIPYRSLIPQTEIKNLLFAGRMIDAQKEAFSALRVMVNTNQMGEAAGVAAGLSVINSCAAKDVYIKLLRETLGKLGAIII